MDPYTNLREQVTTARSIVEAVDKIDLDEDVCAHLSPEIGEGVRNLLWEADRLAELVVALAEWQAVGGFDPRDPIGNSLRHLLSTASIRAYLEQHDPDTLARSEVALRLPRTPEGSPWPDGEWPDAITAAELASHLRASEKALFEGVLSRVIEAREAEEDAVSIGPL